MNDFISNFVSSNWIKWNNCSRLNTVWFLLKMNVLSVPIKWHNTGHQLFYVWFCLNFQIYQTRSFLLEPTRCENGSMKFYFKWFHFVPSTCQLTCTHYPWDHRALRLVATSSHPRLLEKKTRNNERSIPSLSWLVGMGVEIELVCWINDSAYTVRNAVSLNSRECFMDLLQISSKVLWRTSLLFYRFEWNLMSQARA